MYIDSSPFCNSALLNIGYLIIQITMITEEPGLNPSRFFRIAVNRASLTLSLKFKRQCRPYPDS